MNASAREFAEHLAQHPAVERVYYPGVTKPALVGWGAGEDAAHYRAVQRAGDTGRGCLVSFLLKSNIDTKVRDTVY
jgi:cystathionine beta-lyase/cystathionine gamma-synthase